MFILHFDATIFIVVYGGVSLTAGIVNYKRKLVPFWSTLLFSLSGILILTSAMIDVFPILIFSLVLIQLLAIANGLHLYGKINLKHHIIRFLLSIIIIILY